jgi:hypothetical protein
MIPRANEGGGSHVPPPRETSEGTNVTSTFWEDPMNAKLTAEAETLYQTATRLQRVGLIVDRRALSPAQRRAAFALQCRAAKSPDQQELQRARIGFAYPNAR